jgi:hypothetical protein
MTVGVTHDVPVLVTTLEQLVAAPPLYLCGRITQESLGGSVPPEDPAGEVDSHHAIGGGGKEVERAAAPSVGVVMPVVGFRAELTGRRTIRLNTLPNMPRRYGNTSPGAPADRAPQPATDVLRCIRTEA